MKRARCQEQAEQPSPKGYGRKSTTSLSIRQAICHWGFRNKSEDVVKEEARCKGDEERRDGLSEFSASRRRLNEANKRNKSLTAVAENATSRGRATSHAATGASREANGDLGASKGIDSATRRTGNQAVGSQATARTKVLCSSGVGGEHVRPCCPLDQAQAETEGAAAQVASRTKRATLRQAQGRPLRPEVRMSAKMRVRR